MITFDEVLHKYHNEQGEEYISVTTLLGQYKKPFDKEFHATRVASRRGVPIEVVLKEWEDTTVASQTKGTSIHKVMENYILYGDAPKDSMDLLLSFGKVVDSIKHNNVKSEALLWHDEAKIAGMSDLILETDTDFAILDFKTNKKFNYFSAFNEKLLPPLDFLDYCEYNTYSLQLSLYAYMYELISNKRCKVLKVLYLQNNFNNISRFWKEIPIFYCKDTVKNIINQRTK